MQFPYTAKLTDKLLFFLIKKVTGRPLEGKSCKV